MFRDHPAMADGVSRRGLGWADRGARNRALVSDRLQGASLPELARCYGLSERQCRNILREWREAGVAELEADDALAVVHEFIERYRQIEVSLAELAKRADNSAAAVGALRGRTEAVDRQVQLMQAAGLLPKELGQLRLQADVRSVAARVVTVFRDHQVPAETARAVIAALTEEAS